MSVWTNTPDVRRIDGAWHAWPANDGRHATFDTWRDALDHAVATWYDCHICGLPNGH